MKTENARFIENGEISGSEESHNVVIQEVRVEIPIPVTSKFVVPTIVDHPNDIQERQMDDQTLQNDNINNEPVVEPPEVVLRRSQR